MCNSQWYTLVFSFYTRDYPKNVGQDLVVSIHCDTCAIAERQLLTSRVASCDVDAPLPTMLQLRRIHISIPRRCWRCFNLVSTADVATSGLCHGAPASHRSQGYLWVRRTNSLTPTFLPSHLTVPYHPWP